MASITLRHLSKTYPTGVRAVRELDLCAPDGKVTVIVGASGSGKSTLLRMVAGLETPTSGDVLLAEENLLARRPCDRRLAMVLQDPALYPYLSVRGNLSFALRRLRLPPVESARRVDEVAALLDITGLLDRRPHELSGGEAQRVALGRALATRPRALLLDEPLSSLDPPLRFRLRREVAALQRRLGVTLLYVTHDQAEAMALADHLVVMHDGAVLQQGPPAELYERPANRSVAVFLGSPGMNLLAGEVVEGRFQAKGVAEWPVSTNANGPVRLGVRPEDLRLATDDEPALGAAQLVGREPLGHETLLTYQLGDQAMVVRSQPGAASVEVGERRRLTVSRAEAVHLFAADGEGRRLK